MNYKNIIQHAWTLTNSHPKLIWFGFIPALLGTIVGTVYILYQGVAFWAFFNKYSFFEMIAQYGNVFVDFVTHNAAFTVITGIVALILFMLYLFVPIILHGGLVKLLPKIFYKQPFQYRSGLPLGLIYFFPLLKYQTTVAPFNIISLVFFSFMILRNFGLETLSRIWPLLLLMLILDLIVMMFFTFAQYFIVLHNHKYFVAMRNSMKLVFMNLEATFFLMLIMMMIGVRILLNLIGVFLIPGIILLVTYFMAAGTLQVIGIWLGVIAGFAGIIFMSYLTGVLNVFITTLWTMTFHYLLHKTQGFDEMLSEEAKVAEME